MLLQFFQKINLTHLQIALLAYVIRLSLINFGNNYDFDSYKLVVTALQNNITPWETYRYNYGITWSLILLILNFVSMDNQFIFRCLVILILTGADIYIAHIISKKYGQKLALFFLFNPISIIITGYYNQFDNLALAIGLFAILALDNKKYHKSIIYFSLSLTIKHNMLLFLLWILMSNRFRKEKYLICAIPIGIFFIHFLPFIFISDECREAIKSNVFFYWSNNNAPFWQFLVQNQELREYIGNNNLWHHGRLWMILFFLSVSFTGFIKRNNLLLDNFFVYTLALVFFSSAITSQFFAIAAIGAGAYFNPAFSLFFALGTLWLLAEPSGLNLLVIGDFVDFINFDGWKSLPFLLLPGIIYHSLQKRNSKY